MIDKIWDIAIIGSGPAGLTAGIYAARARMSALIIDKVGPGGQLGLAEHIENYPGVKENVKSVELIQNMFEQAKRSGAEFATDEITGLSVSKDNKEINIQAAKKTYRALSVIIAAGASPQRLGVPGEGRLTGKGVSYCAICDAMFFKDKNVVVVGGGDSAIEEALFLTKFCKKVTLIHRRDRLRAVKILQEQIFARKDKVDILWKSTIKEIIGKIKVEAVRVENVDTKETKDIPIDGVFVFVGYKPNSVFLKDFVKTDDAGFIITGENMQTSVKGVFACGDIRKNILKQVVVACGEGAVASFAAQKYVEEIKGMAY